MVVGSAPLRARRLLELAQAGTVVVSGATHQVVRDSFACRPCGPRAAADAGPPAEAFEIVGVRATPHVRLDPLLGRVSEKEAVKHVERALALLDAIAASRARDALELELRLLMTVPLAATRGYSAPEVAACYTRARELCMRVEQAEPLSPLLWGLESYFGHIGRLDVADSLAQQHRRLAEGTGNRDIRIAAHVASAYPAFHRGHLLEAREQLEAAIALYDPVLHRGHTTMYGVDPGAYCSATLAQVLWLQGSPEDALEQSEIAVALAESSRYPVNLALASTLAANLHWFRRDPDELQHWSERALSICQEHGLAHYTALARPLRAMADLLRGGLSRAESQRALADVEAGLALATQLGIQVQRSHCLAMLADADLLTGEYARGVEAIEVALCCVQEHGDAWWRGEMLRLKSELLTHTGSPAEDVERLLQESIETARAQGAQALVDRAECTLAWVRAR